MSKKIIIINIIFILSFEAHSQITSIVRQSVEELFEFLLKSSSKEMMQELSEYGGKEAIEKLLQKSFNEGGEELVQKVVMYGKEYGVSALKVFENSPKLIVDTLNNIPSQMTNRAITAIQRDPSLYTKIIKNHGSEALELSIKHPGIGSKVINEIGENGIELSRSLTTDNLIRFSKKMDGFNNLSNNQKSKIIAALKKSPKIILDELEKHPKLVWTGATVGTIIALADNVLGETIITDDGEIYRKTGFIESLYGQNTFAITFIIIVLVCFFILIYFLYHYTLNKSKIKKS